MHGVSRGYDRPGTGHTQPTPPLTQPNTYMRVRTNNRRTHHGVVDGLSTAVGRLHIDATLVTHEIVQYGKVDHHWLD
jgi:hypothetical protein